MGVAEVSLLRMYTICVQQPASQAILRRSARSIPRFRADFLPFTSQIVEHSRYLPSVSPLSNQGIPLRQVIYPMHIMPRPSGRGKPPFTKILCFALEEVGNNLRLFISHKMPATSHYLCDHVAAAKLFGELFGCWPGLTGAIVAFEKDYRHIQLVAVRSHEYPILSVGSVQTKSSSQL